MAPRKAGNPASEYRLKVERELSRLLSSTKHAAHPRPGGDPLRGVLVLVENTEEHPAGPRVLDALDRSLAAVGLPDAYVTFTGNGYLRSELRLLEPHLVAAVGPEPARELDALGDPLSLKEFSTAKPGVPFAWKRTVTGLLIPSLHPALFDQSLKKDFWNAFRHLKNLA